MAAKKHIDGHMTQKCCHYYNNGKTRPFETVGYKFKHEQSTICKFRTCYNFLVQFRHNQIELEQDCITGLNFMQMETSTPKKVMFSEKVRFSGHAA